MILGIIIISVIGVAFLVVGYLIAFKEKVSLLHGYHYNNLKAEDKIAFCKLSGWGLISIGLGLLVTAVIIGITDSALSFIAFAIGFFVGIGLLVFAGKKYNSKTSK